MSTESLYDYLPHREPMLLLSRIVAVCDSESHAQVCITPQSSFFEAGRGVPSCIGIEYMGQTAALIAGHQQLQGRVGAHLGFLLGTRKLRCETEWFKGDCVLDVRAKEVAVVGDSLATFHCTISCGEQFLAQANLSVFRKALVEDE